LNIVDLSTLKLVETSSQKRDRLQKKPKKKLKKDRSKLQVKKDNPNSGYWKKKADAKWGEYQHKFNRSCIISEVAKDYSCRGPLNQHHLVGRGNVYLRHNILNCAALCAFHHTFSNTLSPHGGPIGFTKFLQEHYPDKYKWVIENQHKTGKPDYRQAYLDLKELTNNV